MDFKLPEVAPLLDSASATAIATIGSGSPIDLAVKGVLAYLIAIWVAFVIWVVRDITNRSSNLIVQTFSILLVVAFTPIFGLPLYLLIRPRSTLFEKYYEEVGLSESENLEERYCEKCEGPISPDYRYCPHCRNELLTPCRECGELVGKDWECCAYCGTESPAEKMAVEIEKPSKSKRKTPEMPKSEDYPEIKSLSSEAEEVTAISEPTIAETTKDEAKKDGGTDMSAEPETKESPKKSTSPKMLSLDEIPEARK